jgi:hypothetical protein
MPRRIAFYFPWQVVAGRPLGMDRLLGYLPRWLQGPRTRDVAGAIGRQLDAIDGLGLDDQLFVATATWGLAWDAPNGDGTTTPTGWERDFGVATQVGDSYATRRARVLGRMQGHALRTAADFAGMVRSMLLPPATGTPTVYQTFGKWAVFKPFDRGFPANFRDVEAALALAGPSNLGLWLAPHREAPDTGLTLEQLGMMRVAAVSVLTVAEISGL